MINHSEAYSKAIVGDSRRQYLRAVFDLIDPELEVTSVTSNSEGEKGLVNQIWERGTEESDFKGATLEYNRWALDGTWDIIPDNPADQPGQIGWLSKAMSDAEGKFVEPFPYVEIEMINVEILQAVTFMFSKKTYNGFPTHFRFQVYSGENIPFDKEVTGNDSTTLIIDGFKVENPTKIRLSIIQWSNHFRYVRVPRILLGLYETWDNSVIKSADIYTEVTFSGLKIPYSTCSIVVENKDHRFDPYNPNSIFTSIEERQAITVELGLRLEDGSIEWLPGGTYFQQSEGWKLKDLTIQFDLLDIIGQLTKRKFVVPSILPTTLSSWLTALMASLGKNFSSNIVVDDDVANMKVTTTSDMIEGKTCGEILRFLCMVTNTWPHQDFETGFLRVGKVYRTEGNKITLDNMYDYPEFSANADVADITFKLDNDEEVTFPGNNTNSETSLSVDNPFIHTKEDAKRALSSVLFEYGGRSFQVNHRGNPSSECGDIQSFDTQFNSVLSARLYKQQLKFDNGVMKNMPSYLVQSPNDSEYKNKVILTGTGTYKAPSVASKLRVTLVGGGAGGMGGGGGNMLQIGQVATAPNQGGTGGSGGMVFVAEFNATANQSFSYTCGQGGQGGAGGAAGDDGAVGSQGGVTTFGSYSTANGKLYPSGFMDVQSGVTYAKKRGGSGKTVYGSYGSGGSGGKNGKNGMIAQYMDASTGEIATYEAAKATAGGNGADGLNGCVIVEW